MTHAVLKYHLMCFAVVLCSIVCLTFRFMFSVPYSNLFCFRFVAMKYKFVKWAKEIKKDGQSQSKERRGKGRSTSEKKESK